MSREARKRVLRIARPALRLCGLLGFDPRRGARNLRAFPGFVRDVIAYRSMRPSEPFKFRLRDCQPYLGEKTEEAGTAGGAYFHQDLWAARRIYQQRPARHIDIGSRLDGFIAHLLTFMPVTVVDIRPIQSQLTGLTFIQDDATQLARLPDNSEASISSLHAAEHFGLGRYSDPVDPQACFRFMASLQRILEPGGRLYFSVPIGRERVEFNAHRIFAASTILASFPHLSLVSFSFVDGAGRLHEEIRPEEAEGADGCGLFEFTKALPGERR
jgi:hypothetical protein